jgi:hypothetical protein
MARMTTARKLLLGLLDSSASAAGGITYLFRDEFTTDASAPLTSPRAADPGPGTATITDTDAILSIVSGILTPSADGFGGSDPRYGLTLTREAGLLWQMKAVSSTVYADTANNSALGIWAAEPTAAQPQNSLVAGFQLPGTASGTAPKMYPGDLAGLPSGFDSAYGVYSIVMTANTAMLFLNDYLEFVYANTTASPWAGIAVRSELRRPFLVEYAHARVLPAPFTTDHGIATLNVASPLDATEYTGDADGIIDLTVTAPGSLDGSATTRCGFYYRADADLSPAWHCYVDGLGTFNVDSIAADGTRTNRITVASVIAGAGVRTLRISTNATKHNAYTLNATTWTKRGSEVAVSLNDTVLTIIPSVPAGWTVANLRSYPRQSVAYTELDPN